MNIWERTITNLVAAGRMPAFLRPILLRRATVEERIRTIERAVDLGHIDADTEIELKSAA